MIIGKFLAITIIAYLLGAIPFGLIIGKLVGKINITEHGSGNIGGTNVLRTVGIASGALVMLLDLSKGAAAVLLAKAIIGESIMSVAGFPFSWQIAQIVAAMMVMVGHNWSIFIKFRGGKGVAAYFGGWFAMYPIIALAGGIILLLTVLCTKHMSKGSILGTLAIMCVLMVLTVLYEFPPAYLVYSLVATALIIYQHRQNISRLQTGTELRLDNKTKNLN